MKRIILAIGLFAISGLTLADQYVRPHVRKDGTYVEGYMRSSPNSTRMDNYSTKGNINPYNGERGHQDPLVLPQPSIAPLPDLSLPRPHRGF